jgi:hypothetical protein
MASACSAFMRLSISWAGCPAQEFTNARHLSCFGVLCQNLSANIKMETMK